MKIRHGHYGGHGAIRRRYARGCWLFRYVGLLLAARAVYHDVDAVLRIGATAISGFVLLRLLVAATSLFVAVAWHTLASQAGIHE